MTFAAGQKLFVEIENRHYPVWVCEDKGLKSVEVWFPGLGSYEVERSQLLSEDDVKKLKK